jgi:hypothetical protein
MLNEVLPQLPSLGIAGLLFVMWWIERQERTRGGAMVQQSGQRAAQLVEINDHLLDVIRCNTEALSALREELHSHREIETEWMSRLSRQLEKLEFA